MALCLSHSWSEKISAFYGTRRFITVSTRTRRFSLSWASLNYHSFSRSVLILSSHLHLYFEVVSFLHVFRKKYVFMSLLVCTIFPCHPHWLHHPDRLVRGEDMYTVTYFHRCKIATAIFCVWRCNATFFCPNSDLLHHTQAGPGTFISSHHCTLLRSALRTVQLQFLSWDENQLEFESVHWPLFRHLNLWRLLSMPHYAITIILTWDSDIKSLIINETHSI
jgi:hypothetical protein